VRCVDSVRFFSLVWQLPTNDVGRTVSCNRQAFGLFFYFVLCYLLRSLVTVFLAQPRDTHTLK
jgi:hypothetical protein